MIVNSCERPHNMTWSSMYVYTTQPILQATAQHPIIEEAGWPLSPTAEIHPAHAQCNWSFTMLNSINGCLFTVSWLPNDIAGGTALEVMNTGVGIVRTSNMTTTVIEAFLIELCYRKPWVVNHTRCLAAIILFWLIKLTNDLHGVQHVPTRMEESCCYDNGYQVKLCCYDNACGYQLLQSKICYKIFAVCTPRVTGMAIAAFIF